MITEIIHELNKIEATYNIKILYAVESGSRAWGFASKNSDWDVRFIYVHPLDWYLSIDDRKDNIEVMLPNDIDLAGWELQKALRLFKKSNPPLLEWLRSPIIYKEAGPTTAALREAVNLYFNPKSCLYHYFHMARGNYEAYFKTKEVRLKKYFYVLRPVLACMWIERTGEMPPMEFELLMEHELTDQNLITEIDALLKRKKAGDELDKGDRIGVIDNFLLERLLYFTEVLKTFDSIKTPDFTELNKIFRASLKQSWNN